MSTRARVSFDKNRLLDILIIERTSGSVRHGESPEVAFDSHVKIKIDLDEDQLVDDIIASLTKFRAEGRVRLLEGKVKRLEGRYSEFNALLSENQRQWTVIEESRKSTYQELLETRDELSTLRGGK